MHRTLIGTAELAAQLEAPDWVVFDCRHDLADPAGGRRAYAESHIPGARFLHLDDDLSAPRTGSNGRHPLPDAAPFAALLGRNGVARSCQVVAYDAAGGAFAARLWWMLRWLGHEDVAVLDGGWQKWLAEGRPVSAQPAAARPTRFSVAPPAEQPVDATTVSRAMADGSLLLDARSPERFRGEGETLDPVGGHIPGAVNRFFRDNLGSDGCFLAPEALRRAYLALLGPRDPAEVIQYCGSGVTACHNMLAMEIAGLPGSRLYPGSWSEWCADPRRPMWTPG